MFYIYEMELNDCIEQTKMSSHNNLATIQGAKLNEAHESSKSL